MMNAPRVALVALAILLIACATKQDGARGGKISDDEAYAQAVAYQTVDASALAALEPGMTVEDWLSRVHTLGRHEITCSGEGGDVIAIHSFFVCSTAADRTRSDLPMVWSVFINGRYVKVVHYVNHSTMDGIIDARAPQCDSGMLIERMRSRAMAAVVARRYDLDTSVSRTQEPADPALSGAFVLLGSSVASSVKRSAAINHRLLVTYSGDRVKIGDGPDDVAAVLGPPSGIRSDRGRPDDWIAQYGDFPPPDVIGQDRARPVIVVYASRRVVMILSNEFYLECVGYRKELGLKAP